MCFFFSWKYRILRVRFLLLVRQLDPVPLEAEGHDEGKPASHNWHKL